MKCATRPTVNHPWKCDYLFQEYKSRRFDSSRVSVDLDAAEDLRRRRPQLHRALARQAYQQDDDRRKRNILFACGLEVSIIKQYLIFLFSFQMFTSVMKLFFVYILSLFVSFPILKVLSAIKMWIKFLELSVMHIS